MNRALLIVRVAAFATCLLATNALAEVLVCDTDTIVVQGTPVRLNGVDAPELGTRAGQDSSRWMVNFFARQESGV